MVILDTDKYIERGIKYGTLSPESVKVYQYAQQRANLKLIDSEKLVELWDVVLEAVKSSRISIGIADNFMKLVSGTANMYGIEMPKCLSRTEFYDIRNANWNPADAYTDEQIKTLLDTAFKRGSFDLFRLLVFLTLSGLRARAAHGVRPIDIKPVEGVEGVYYYQVNSKGKTYYAVIGQNGFDWLHYGMENYEVPFCRYRQTSKNNNFHRAYRQKFNNLVHSANLHSMFKDVETGEDHNLDPFNSFRKWYQRRLLNDGLGALDIELLAGRTPGQAKDIEAEAGSSGVGKVMFKHYVNVKGKIMPLGIVGRMARAYALSSLPSFTFEGAAS